jgi:uncharacterized protein with ParB-like and HNH nuclease domain
MREILGKAKTVKELLKGARYAIDYYQREYKWRTKQIRELVNDLASKFLEEHDEDYPREKVADYPHYFLGSIIISKKDNTQYIVDGQQRLTSLTLLLIYLRSLQEDRNDQVNIDDLIVSEKYGKKSFNMDVPERVDVMEALFDNEPFDLTDQPESVQNLYERYNDIQEGFPEELSDTTLPYFIDWLLENVHLVEITAYADEDAYTIFETMNDRGLSLSPTEMLKGYLLTNISDDRKRAIANDQWRDRILELDQAGKDVEPDFFKAWLRSQYATKIRERRKGAKPEDFDRIGTEYHRWLREYAARLGLQHSDDYYQFINRDFDFYSRQYLRLIKASNQLVDGLEHVLYNAQHGFTLQHMLLLAPLQPDDPEQVVMQKLRIMARFIDILLAWRLWNFRSIAYSTMQYAMFLVMREARSREPQQLARTLYERLCTEGENFNQNSPYHRRGVGLHLHQQNRYALHRLLASITDYVETNSGLPSRYLDYVSGGSKRYEVEHIWADKPERHQDEFQHTADFNEQRNRFGGLLLLPRAFNASYGALPYKEKLKHYNSQNLLARSLHPDCYEHNPGFLKFIDESRLPFRPHEEFRKTDLDERHDLYRQIAEQVWNPEDLLREMRV